MNLKHLNLTVTDVGAASAFLEGYFGLRSTGGNAGRPSWWTRTRSSSPW